MCKNDIYYPEKPVLMTQYKWFVKLGLGFTQKIVYTYWFHKGWCNNTVNIINGIWYT